MALRQRKLMPAASPRTSLAALSLALFGLFPAHPLASEEPAPHAPAEENPAPKPEYDRPPRLNWRANGEKAADDHEGPGGDRREGRFERLPEPLRKRLESLPPEQRDEFRRNWKRWNDLPPEERERLRKRQKEHLDRARKEMESIIQESGIKLDASQRERFKRYYFSERRALELNLLRDMEERRRTRLLELRKKLINTLLSGEIPDVGPPPPAEGRPERPGPPGLLDPPPNIPLAPAPPKNESPPPLPDAPYSPPPVAN